mgnify:CR=1 FL=1
MKKYKITNLKTNIIQFMNEKEKENFMQINNKNNSYYFAEELKENNKKEILKTFFLVLSLCILFICSILLHIQLNY